MTDYEFTQIMREAGYEVSDDVLTWFYKNNKDFFLVENKKENRLELHLLIYQNYGGVLDTFDYVFMNYPDMNSVEFKKKLEGITEYAYCLYKDINRHIDAISKKMETKANRLGM